MPTVQDWGKIAVPAAEMRVREFPRLSQQGFPLEAEGCASRDSMFNGPVTRVPG